MASLKNRKTTGGITMKSHSNIFIIRRDHWSLDNIMRYISCNGGWTRKMQNAKVFKTQLAAKRVANKYLYCDVYCI